MPQRLLRLSRNFPGEVSEMANCRKICVYRQFCAEKFPDYAGGENGERPHVSCPMAWKIEDILMDAEDIRKEQEIEDELPFDEEDYDGPEVEGL